MTHSVFSTPLLWSQLSKLKIPQNVLTQKQNLLSSPWLFLSLFCTTFLPEQLFQSLPCFFSGFLPAVPAWRAFPLLTLCCAGNCLLPAVSIDIVTVSRTFSRFTRSSCFELPAVRDLPPSFSPDGFYHYISLASFIQESPDSCQVGPIL